MCLVAATRVVPDIRLTGYPAIFKIRYPTGYPVSFARYLVSFAGYPVSHSGYPVSFAGYPVSFAEYADKLLNR